MRKLSVDYYIKEHKVFDDPFPNIVGCRSLTKCGAMLMLMLMLMLSPYHFFSCLSLGGGFLGMRNRARMGCILHSATQTK